MGPAGARARTLTARLLCAALVAGLSACSHGAAAQPLRTAVQPFPSAAQALRSGAAGGRRARTQAQAGAFHHVRPGETLFRIARTYGVPVETLRRENALADAAHVAAGTVLFIPGAERELAVAAASAPPRKDPPSPHVAGDAVTTASSGSEEPAPSAPRGQPAKTKAKQAAGRVVIPQRPSPRPRPAQRTDAGSLGERAGQLAWPVHGVLFSPFGPRARDQHDGIDLAAPEGTAVVAADAGTVLFAGERRGYGNIILVGHEGGVVTVYAHNRENLVSPGEHVGRGAMIARVGRSGNATGPHLHFEVRVAARPRDPLRYLR